MSAAIAFVNGHFTPELSDVSRLPDGVTVRGIEGGLFMSLAEGCEIAQPVKFIYISDGQVEEINLKHIIEMGRQSKLTVVDEFGGQPEKSMYTADVRITQQQDSKLSFVCLKNGAKSSHDTMHITLAEQGADCKTAGFYQTQRDNQSVTYHVTIEHVAAYTTSDMLFKGIAENKSCARFTGRLHVHPHAQKIVAHQANHHLLLTRDAEVYSKPELEIYADDVKCKHGSTTGELDHDALFYLRARGITEDEAKRMLIAGFADEVLRRAQ